MQKAKWLSEEGWWFCESAALDMSENLENSLLATGLEKFSFYSKPKERQCQKSSNYCTIALISQACKVMLKILQDSLQQYMNHELPDAQTGFRKGRGTRIKSPRSIGSSRKQGIQKNIYFYFVDYAKVFDCVDHNKL